MRVYTLPCRMSCSRPGSNFSRAFDEEVLREWSADRVVVGNAVSRGNPQVEWLLRERLAPFVCLPQLIGEELIGTRPAVVVAGTHGKTTTTSLTAFALSEAGVNPGYLVGGVPLDLPSGNELGDPDAPFVIEGDEYDSAFSTSAANSFTIGPVFSFSIT